MKFKAPIEVESSLVDSSNSSGSAGQVLTSTGTGVDWIDPTLLPAESAEKVIQTVRLGEAVSKGDPLVITGYHGSNGPAIVERADATNSTYMPAYGVALEDYAINATGLMIAVGDFNDFDTSGYSVGDTLYVAVGGGMTNVKPTGTALIQNMGIVSRSNANNGDVEIVAIGRTNDVPNLPEGRLFVGTSGNTSLTSDVVYIDDANDRVGIGTDSPTHLLNLSEDSTNSVQLVIDNTNTTDAGTETSEIRFRHYRSYVAGQNDAGEIIVGKEQAWDAAGDRNSYMAFGTRKGSDAVVEKMRIDSSGQAFFKSSTDYKIGLNDSAGVNQWWFKSYTSGDFSIHENGLGDRFNIKAGGNVGIGTTSPGYKLDVNGVINVSDNNPIRSGDEIMIRRNNSTNLLRVGSGDAGDKTQFYAGGSERMRIDTNGNVGIGTTSPATKLHIQNGSSGQAYTLLSGALIDVNGTSNSYSALRVGSSTGSNHLVVTNAGNVGIGATIPSQKLEVAGNIQATGSRSISAQYNADHYIRLESNSSGGVLKGTDGGVITTLVRTYGDSYFNGGNVGIGTTSPTNTLDILGKIKIDADGTYGAAYSTIGFGGTTNGYNRVFGNNSTADGLFLASATGRGIYFRANGSTTSHMAVASNGNVGIGTTSPGAKLDVNKSTSGNVASFKSNVTAINEYAGITIHSRTVSGVDWYGSEIRNINTAGTPSFLNPRLGFFTQNNGTYLPADRTEKMSILGSGNVGIGTTSPGAKLEVNSGNTNTVAKFESTDSTARIVLKDNAGEVHLNAIGDDMVFATSSSVSERMRITSTGNVGIGTTSPGSKLEILGADPLLELNTISATGNPYMLFAQNGNRRAFIQYVNGGLLSLVSEYGDIRMMTGTGGTEVEKMRITSTGNVGIGTTSPNATLTVKKLAASFEVTTTNDESNLLSYDRTNSLYKSIVMRGSNLSVNPNDAGERLSVTTSGLTSTNIAGWKGTFTHQNAATNIPCIETFTSNSYPNWAIGWQHQRTSTSTYGNIAKFLSNTGSQIGIIGYNGASGVTYGTTSDYRLKENIVAIDNAIERVNNLKPCRFNFIEEKEYTQDGFIAHELAEVVPEAVTGEKDGEQMQSVDKSKVIPLLTKALQDAINKIQELEIRIQTLENN